MGKSNLSGREHLVKLYQEYWAIMLLTILAGRQLHTHGYPAKARTITSPMNLLRSAM